MEKKNLVKVSTYATYMGVSTMAIYKQIERKVLKCEMIDGVTFIVVDDETYKDIQANKR